MENELKAPQDVVMWLWNAHNKVNRRLSGDITEDPKHPKIQFPSRAMCPRCRIEENGNEIVWDKAIVLRFLLHFYGKEYIVHDDESTGDLKIKDDNQSSENEDSGNSSMVILFNNVSFFDKWQFRWFTFADFSLCISLYLVSALLLVIIFLIFRQRRRRKKVKRYIHLYP